MSASLARSDSEVLHAMNLLSDVGNERPRGVHVAIAMSLGRHGEPVIASNLERLVEGGYLTERPSGRYELTPKALRLADGR